MMRQLLWIPALLIVAASLTSGSDDSQADKRGAAVTHEDTPGTNRGPARPHAARLRAPRIEPVKRESWTAAQRELLEPVRASGTSAKRVHDDGQSSGPGP